MICHYRSGFEIDLCWNDGDRFVNVVWDMSSPDTVKRETKALDAGLSLLPNANARLVYGIGDHIPDSHQAYAIEGWKYLLGI